MNGAGIAFIVVVCAVAAWPIFRLFFPPTVTKSSYEGSGRRFLIAGAIAAVLVALFALADKK